MYVLCIHPAQPLGLQHACAMILQPGYKMYHIPFLIVNKVAIRAGYRKMKPTVQISGVNTNFKASKGIKSFKMLDFIF